MEQEELKFNVEFCQIKGKNKWIEARYWLKKLWIPILFFIIIIITAIILISPKTGNTQDGWFTVTVLILTSLLTFSLLLLNEFFRSAKGKLLYFDGFMMEIKNNMEFLNANIKTAVFENKRLNKNKLLNKNIKPKDLKLEPNDFVLEPIFPLQFEFWELLKANMSLKDLNMDTKKLERFFYDARRYNELIIYRNNVKLFSQAHAPKDRRKYNLSLIMLGDFAKDHLKSALRDRGILVFFDQSQMKQFKEDYEDGDQFVKFLETCKKEFENIKFTSNNKKEIIKSFNRKPDEFYIYYYDSYGSVKI